MSGTNPKVLIVEATPIMRSLIRGQLKGMGIERITEARDGGTAQEILQKQPVDLIISDYDTPGMSGLELLQWVRRTRHLADLPFILLSTATSQGRILQAARSRVSQFLLKPFSQDHLEKKVTAALHNASLLPTAA